MLKELFRIPGFDYPVYTYGLMLVIGTLAAIHLAKVLARRQGYNPELFVNAGLLALLAGVLGARLSHVLENTGQYFGHGKTILESLLMAINIREGGLTYYGGFLLAFPVLVLYAIWVKVPIRKGMDIIAPCLMVGLAFGRIGCFLNGCCYGQESSSTLAVTFPYYSDPYLDQVHNGEIHPPSQLMVEGSDGRGVLIPPHLWKGSSQEDRAMRALLLQQQKVDEGELKELMSQQRSLPVYPTQLYSTVAEFLLVGLLLAFMLQSTVPGRAFALMLMIEPITRFILEMIRVEPAVWGHMSLSMVLAIPQFALGVALWFAFGWWHRARDQSLSPQPTGAAA